MLHDASRMLQATTAQTSLLYNVHFNGPRAGVNFNDGFGGGDVMEGNLLANCVRESGDHGTRSKHRFVRIELSASPSLLGVVQFMSRWQ